jgi:hypothetical protein
MHERLFIYSVHIPCIHNLLLYILCHWLLVLVGACPVLSTSSFIIGLFKCMVGWQIIRHLCCTTSYSSSCMIITPLLPEGEGGKITPSRLSRSVVFKLDMDIHSTYSYAAAVSAVSQHHRQVQQQQLWVSIRLPMLSRAFILIKVGLFSVPTSCGWVAVCQHKLSATSTDCLELSGLTFTAGVVWCCCLWVQSKQLQ